MAILFLGGTWLGLIQAQTTNGQTASPPIQGVVRFTRGVNLGNALEAPHEGDWGVTLREDYFPAIRKAGFDAVRVPIRWSAHVSSAPDYTIDPAFFGRVDWVVAQAEKNDLTAILDYHNDDALMRDPDANAGRFVAIWRQIAARYQAASPSILFELLNEPNGRLDASRWNDLLGRTLAVVRANNPTRTIVVGPVAWNGIWMLPKLVLPEGDQNLLVTVHFYDPMIFTHQGASWIAGSDKWLGNTWRGTDAQRQAITQGFDHAAEWGSAHHRPIFLGEFGSYSKGDMDSRARWSAFVARTAESHDFPWAYWEFCSGFGVYDSQVHAWRPLLLNALLPK